MATQVVMPKLSPTMEEGQLARWLKKEGDTVSMGEPLAEIDTDKATMEMQSLGNGVLRKILVQEGESAPLGQIIAIIGEADEDISAMLSEAQSSQGAASDKAPAKAPADENQEVPAATAAAPPDSTGDKSQASSSAGNGAGAQASGDGADSGRLVVSPIAARMAAEAGINLRSLKGSGPSGRIIKRDIEEAIKAGQTQGEAKEVPATGLRAVEPATPLRQPEIFGASAYRDEPMSEIRRVIARRLVTSI
ncbi:MAG TPA: biotin/lipoyl-containing protein, partial [Pyrinomonadaceae bacterium]|nr:biotin/lipoyl-containing protein [Pyrinomonadaceae bacterium]